jgi:flagellar motility protein MotE (MotC chaperone)
LATRYSCKGCGDYFFIENEIPSVKGGCLGSIVKIIVFIVVVMIGISVFIAKDRKSDNSSPSTSQEEKSTQDNSDQIRDAEAAVEAERSEKAAHEYIPTEEDYKKLEQTQKVHKSDNLTIVETTRDSVE